MRECKEAVPLKDGASGLEIQFAKRMLFFKIILADLRGQVNDSGKKHFRGQSLPMPID